MLASNDPKITKERIRTASAGDFLSKVVHLEIDSAQHFFVIMMGEIMNLDMLTVIKKLAPITHAMNSRKRVSMWNGLSKCAKL